MHSIREFARQSASMKSDTLHQFRNKLRADEPVYGLWVTLEAAAVADIAAGLGFDWIGIDAASGHLDWLTVQEHVRATVRSQTVTLVRVADTTPVLCRRALQLGADGVLLPCPDNVAQLQALLEQIGCANRAQGPGVQALVGLVVNRPGNVNRLREFAQSDGVDFFFFEPTHGDKAQARMDRLVSEIRDAGKHAGIVAETDHELSQQLARQFTILGVGIDAGIIRRGIQETMSTLDQR